MLKLLIVNGEPEIRRGIRKIIDGAHCECEIIGEAEDLAAASAAVLELKPNLLVLDLESALWCSTGKSTGGGEAKREDKVKTPENPAEKDFFSQEKKVFSRAGVQNKAFAGEKKDVPFTAGGEEKVLKLCAYIQLIDHKMIQNFFAELENEFFISGKCQREIRQECISFIIEVRTSLVKKIPALKEMLGSGKETFDAIMNLPSLGDIIDAMLEASLRISGCFPLLSADNSFQRIISYVKNNYSENLNLENLGNLFHYNSAYLGKRFKRHTGKSFHAYLDILRIEAAKELLRTTAMKVYEISTTVGYSNSDYFYVKFRKYAGQSPLFYRSNDESY